MSAVEYPPFPVSSGRCQLCNWAWPQLFCFTAAAATAFAQFTRYFSAVHLEREEDGERERRILSKPFENGETKSMGRGRQGKRKQKELKFICHESIPPARPTVSPLPWTLLRLLMLPDVFSADEIFLLELNCILGLKIFYPTS